jgi:signal transduction histidine kinase
LQRSIPFHFWYAARKYGIHLASDNRAIINLAIFVVNFLFFYRLHIVEVRALMKSAHKALPVRAAYGGGEMKLSEFIKKHLEDIIKEWESFAKTLLPAADGMSQMELRDHVKQILTAVTQDIETQQSPEQEKEKSKGNAPSDENSAASSHGTLRQVSGFTLVQLTAEYRALRATVLRLWLPQVSQMTEDVVADMVRFNEAIDQAQAESVITYSKHAAVVRDTFLAILGHDLRSPLATMAMAGDYLSEPSVGTDITLQIGLRVKRSAATMSAMVNDLLEYARSQLDGHLPISRAQVDVMEICKAAMEDTSSAHPECPFELEASGDLTGYFDRARLQQVLSNLLNNAAQYRGTDRPVTVLIEGSSDALLVKVCNFGPVIPSASLKTIFEPLVQLPISGQQPGRPATSLGLGLFIAREITQAHGGAISVESDETLGTRFSVHLPRETKEATLKATN